MMLDMGISSVEGTGRGAPAALQKEAAAPETVRRRPGAPAEAAAAGPAGSREGREGVRRSYRGLESLKSMFCATCKGASSGAWTEQLEGANGDARTPSITVVLNWREALHPRFVKLSFRIDLAASPQNGH